MPDRPRDKLAALIQRHTACSIHVGYMASSPSSAAPSPPSSSSEADPMSYVFVFAAGGLSVCSGATLYTGNPGLAGVFFLFAVALVLDARRILRREGAL